MSRKLLVASSAVVFTCSLAAFAQQAADRPVAAPGAQQPAATAQWKNTDHGLASCVAAGNQVEIGIAQFASEKTKNEEVQNFAMMLVRDHKDFLQKLGKYTPEAAADGYVTRFDSKEARTDSKSPNKAVTPRSNRAVAGANNPNAANPPRVQYTAGFRPGDVNQFPHSQIERELAQQCLTSVTEKLGAESSPEFDKCFIGQQIGAHMAMRDKLIVYQRHASSELGQLLATGQKKTEEHLAKAEELMKSLDQGSKTASETPKNRKANAKDGAQKTTTDTDSKE